jgi:hypothetical protein
MHRRHEAVRRGFEWFDAGFDAGLTHQRSEAGTLYRATNETHPTRACHTIAPHPNNRCISANHQVQSQLPPPAQAPTSPPRCAGNSRSSADDLDPLGLEDLVEARSEALVAVVHEEADRFRKLGRRGTPSRSVHRAELVRDRGF